MSPLTYGGISKSPDSRQQSRCSVGNYGARLGSLPYNYVKILCPTDFQYLNMAMQ